MLYMKEIYSAIKCQPAEKSLLFPGISGKFAL